MSHHECPLNTFPQIVEPGQALRAGKLTHNVLSQRAVAFELRLGKKLVADRVLWERLILMLVVEDVTRLIAVKRGLDVNQVAVRAALIDMAVTDLA